VSNRELVVFGSSVEVYTDYCHLTSKGNEILAEMIGKRILASPKRAVPSRGD